MTLAELRALDIPALWAALSADQQAEIGTAALAFQFAGLVAGDDGTETTAAERDTALGMESEAQRGLERVTEEAFPNVTWWDP